MEYGINPANFRLHSYIEGEKIETLFSIRTLKMLNVWRD